MLIMCNVECESESESDRERARESKLVSNTLTASK